MMRNYIPETPRSVQMLAALEAIQRPEGKDISYAYHDSDSDGIADCVIFYCGGKPFRRDVAYTQCSINNLWSK